MTLEFLIYSFSVLQNKQDYDQFWFQLMHHNFTLLTKSIYMFRATTCPSSGGQTIYTPQLVHELEPKLIITTMHGQQHIKKKNKITFGYKDIRPYNLN